MLCILHIGNRYEIYRRKLGIELDLRNKNGLKVNIRYQYILIEEKMVKWLEKTDGIAAMDA